MEKQSFLKNHADTLAIIAVNVAIAALILNMTIANTYRVDSANVRIDAANSRSDALHQELVSLIKGLK